MSSVLPLTAASADMPRVEASASHDARDPLPERLRLDKALRGPSRQFFRAPQSASGWLAALMEPALIAGAFAALHFAQQVPFDRVSVVTALLVITLTYPGRDRFSMRPRAAFASICSTWLALLALLLVFALASRSLADLPGAVMVPWIVLTPLLMFVATWVGAALLRRSRRHDAVTRHAVVVGGGPLGVRTAQAVSSRSDVPSDVVGFFDDRGEGRLEKGAQGRLLGRLDEAARYVEKLGIREVYICLPLASQPRVTRLLDALQGTTASLYVVPDVVGISVVQGRLADVSGLPVVGICETPFSGVNAFAKRVSDVALSAVILLLCAPLMLLFAVAVKLSSPGPVLYKQRRNGLDGEEIFVYKFRTMRVGSEGPWVPQATRNDSRVTAVGRVLRRMSLDELPQFINVLQGRMSIVGPRPHAVVHNEMYRRLIKGYMVRHKARPGITGWAQINGFRGETETVAKMKDRVSLDLEYLRNWSLRLDLVIIWRTLRLIVSDAKAY